MSSEHESSYYEIALTNRQVLTIFVVLLTCLVAAFLSGVWIGRRDGSEEALQASAAEEQAAPATAEMTELNFFSDAPPRDGDRGAAPKTPPRQLEAPARDPGPLPPTIEEERPPPAQEPAAPSPTPARPPTRAPAPPPAAGGGRVIQVFSTLDAAQADRLVKRLGDGGYPVYLVEESLQGRTTYRVRVGPYEQEERAQKIAEELRRQYRLETWITSQSG